MKKENRMKLVGYREDEEFSDKVNGGLNGLFLVQGANLNVCGVAVNAPLHLSRDLMIRLKHTPNKKIINNLQ